VAKRREEQRLETARRIKAAALELFEERGFDATTTPQIAERAGVAQGTVFLVAPSKDALLVAALEDRLKGIVAERQTTMPRRSVKAQILHVVDGMFDFHAAKPALSRVFTRAVLFFSEEAARAQYEEHVVRFVAFIATLIDKARARGEIAAATDPDVAAANVVALYAHVLVQFLNEPVPDRAALAARFRAGLELMVRGLR